MSSSSNKPFYWINFQEANLLNNGLSVIDGTTQEKNPGRFGPWTFRPFHFGSSRFGQFLGLVVSALEGGSFWSDF